jgi:UDP-N-acetylmuramate: L-alanyl-gamma-D-glutamyl-meso-diaminopimelate ligase
MKLHILGICGTFMGGVAALARELGHSVDGSDQGIYPPMSTQLEQLGIALTQGYSGAAISSDHDIVVVATRSRAAMPRSSTCWTKARLHLRRGVVARQRAARRRTLAVAGTHGKTNNDLDPGVPAGSRRRAPGFLVGGVPENFGVSGAHRRRHRFRRGSGRVRHRLLRQALESSCTTGRPWRCSTTSSTTTPTSSRTWRPSSASSTTSCASCRAMAA